jgi:predicted nucleic acid-binding protein
MEGSVVLDTSVILKWFRQEEVLAGQALALRDAYLDGRIGVVVPSLVAYELANVLRYKADLTTDQVQEAVQSLFGMGLEWVLPSSATMGRAVGIARAYEATVYDAAFAALAEWMDATFVTADERLAHRLEPLPFVRFLDSVNAE